MSVEAKSTAINGWTAGRIFREPLLWLGLVLVVLAVLLSLPLSVAIGPMYWDTYLYLDAAQRIAMGQTPNVDFQVPVGPLVYYLFTWGLELFPRAQLLLLAQWCLLAVAAPLMAVVIADTAKRSHGLAFALLIPFLVFALAPVNALTYSSFPSLDGYSIYNRHSVLLLYVLVSGLLFIRDGRKLAWFCALAMMALFLTKITAFLAGGMIGLFALLAGRIALRNVALAALIFVVPLAVSEFAVHFVSSYLSNIAQLVGLNEGSWLSRVLMVISAKLNVLVPVGVMCAMLAWLSLGAEKAVPFFDRSYWWLGVATLAGIAFETQNTGGGQEFIFLWPILLMAWPRLKGYEKRSQAILLVLAAFSVVPTISNVAHRVLRSVAVLPTYQTLDLPLLKNMEQVATRADHMERAARNVSHYIEFSDTYESLARQGQAPSWNYYSELDFQIYFLIDIAAGAQAILDFEAANSVRLNTLMTLEFTNPFPWLLDRDATRHIQIGADPFRTIPPMTPEIKAAIDATDAVIRPKCPVTSGRLAVESIYSEALENRQVVEIHPCWDLLLRPGLLPAP